MQMERKGNWIKLKLTNQTHRAVTGCLAVRCAAQEEAKEPVPIARDDEKVNLFYSAGSTGNVHKDLMQEKMEEIFFLNETEWTGKVRL